MSRPLRSAGIAPPSSSPVTPVAASGRRGRSGRTSGSPNYDIIETRKLAELALLHAPNGGNKWKAVTDALNAFTGRDRKIKSVKDRFAKMLALAKNKPTGDPEVKQWMELVISAEERIAIGTSFSGAPISNRNGYTDQDLAQFDGGDGDDEDDDDDANDSNADLDALLDVDDLAFNHTMETMAEVAAAALDADAELAVPPSAIVPSVAIPAAPPLAPIILPIRSAPPVPPRPILMGSRSASKRKRDTDPTSLVLTLMLRDDAERKAKDDRESRQREIERADKAASDDRKDLAAERQRQHELVMAAEGRKSDREFLFVLLNQNRNPNITN